MRNFTLGLLAALVLLPSCGSRNIYRRTQLSNPPIERGYVYMSRTQLMEAGQEPVEFGSPLVTKDIIYVATETNGLEAFERNSFRRKWQFKVKNSVSGELTLDNGALYFGANDGNVYAVDAEFGKQIWKYETKAPVYARPTVVNKKVYFNSSDDIVYCLNQTNGKWIWHYKRGGNYITTVHGNSSPAVDATAGLAVVGFSDGYVVALNANDGNLKWEQKIHKGSKFTDVDAMPLIDGNHIYIPSYDGELYSLDKSTGKVVWHIDVGGSKKVIMDDKVLFLAGSTGFVYSINKDTGRINWKFEMDEGAPTNLVQRDHFIAFGSSRQYFYVVNKGNGSLAYRYSAGLRSGFFSTPAQIDRDIFILSSFGNLYVFHWLDAGDRARNSRL